MKGCFKPFRQELVQVVSTFKLDTGQRALR